MATVYLDRVDTLSMIERLGVIRSMTRKARVIFTDMEQVTDFSMPDFALEELDKLGITPYQILNTVDYQSLVLVEREASIVEGEPTCVDVVLKYEHILDGPNQVLTGQDFNIPSFGNIQQKPLLYGKVRASIVEKETNFYRFEGKQENPETRIEVAHEFNPRNVPVGGVNTLPNLPFTVIQGGEIKIPFPQSNFTIQGVIATQNPYQIADSFIAKINKNTWLGKPPKTWICSEVQAEILNTETSLYKFVFEFQYNFDGWDPRVVFKDDRTGRPPYNIKAATEKDEFGVSRFVLNTKSDDFMPAGYWDVPALTPVDFNDLFGKFFEDAF